MCNGLSAVSRLEGDCLHDRRLSPRTNLSPVIAGRHICLGGGRSASAEQHQPGCKAWCAGHAGGGGRLWQEQPAGRAAQRAQAAQRLCQHGRCASAADFGVRAQAWPAFMEISVCWWGRSAAARAACWPPCSASSSCTVMSSAWQVCCHISAQAQCIGIIRGSGPSLNTA